MVAKVAVIAIVATVARGTRTLTSGSGSEPRVWGIKIVAIDRPVAKRFVDAQVIAQDP